MARQQNSGTLQERSESEMTSQQTTSTEHPSFNIAVVTAFCEYLFNIRRAVYGPMDLEELLRINYETSAWTRANILDGSEEFAFYVAQGTYTNLPSYVMEDDLIRARDDMDKLIQALLRMIAPKLREIMEAGRGDQAVQNLLLEVELLLDLNGRGELD